MSRIKQRRLEEIVVPPHPGTHVGDYVPFDFCPRSVMLYVIHRGNDADLSYRGGQWPVLRALGGRDAGHRLGRGRGRPWALSSDPGNRLAEFSARRQDLDRLDRTAIESLDFRDRAVKEAKQAEFLIHDRLPFEFIDKIGAATDTVRGQALEILAASGYEPNVETTPTWYY